MRGISKGLGVEQDDEEGDESSRKVLWLGVAKTHHDTRLRRVGAAGSSRWFLQRRETFKQKQFWCGCVIEVELDTSGDWEISLLFKGGSSAVVAYFTRGRLQTMGQEMSMTEVPHLDRLVERVIAQVKLSNQIRQKLS